MPQVIYMPSKVYLDAVQVMKLSIIDFQLKTMLNKNTLGVKKCEANQKQHCKQVRPKTLISVEAKKLLIKIFFTT